VRREIGEKGTIRSSGFEVPRTSNFGPRTLPRLACPASRARISYTGFSCCATGAVGVMLD
jgi:hypothetical protein